MPRFTAGQCRLLSCVVLASARLRGVGVQTGWGGRRAGQPFLLCRSVCVGALPTASTPPSCCFIFNLGSPNSAATWMKSEESSPSLPPSSSVRGGESEQPRHRAAPEVWPSCPCPSPEAADPRQGWPLGCTAVRSRSGRERVHRGDAYPSSSLVFAARSLSISAAALSAICWICRTTQNKSEARAR